MGRFLFVFPEFFSEFRERILKAVDFVAFVVYDFY